MGYTHFLKKLTPLVCVFLFSCQKAGISYLEQALEQAGPNRAELETVITHYSRDKTDSLKLKAALFLIENMPGHYSYAGEDINRYYEEITPLLTAGTSSAGIKEEIEKIAEKYPQLAEQTVQDIEIITAGYLIDNIEQAFRLWQKPWAQQLDFGQFCEYLLPYKCFERQQLDQWKDTLQAVYTNCLEIIPYNDDTSETVFHISHTLLRQLRQTLNPSANAVNNSHPFQSASTCYRMPYGTYQDYNHFVVALLRSFGIAAFTESFPQWGRGHGSHSWCSVLNDHALVMPSQWGVYTDFTSHFFPEQSIPKVYRQTYSINRQTEEYFRKSRYKHPVFSVFNKDVTDEYMLTSNLSIPVFDRKLTDEYVYIALFGTSGWHVADYGTLEKKQARFEKIGRNILYIVLGADETGLVPVSDPFIVERGGKITYLKADTSVMEEVVLKRIYPKKYYTTGSGTDEDTIFSGHTYELKYWDSGGWCSLGVKTAEQDFLLFDHVPSNALLWLSDRTQQKRERIFTYRDNKQVWW